MIGTWILYIPQIKQKLQLNDAELGSALFCLAIGLLSVMPFTSFITKKVGLGRCTLISVCIFALAYIGPILATNYQMLCALLYVVGIFSGLTDISMNTVVSEIEKEDKVNFMSAAHGFFSLGGALGTLLGAILMAVSITSHHHVLIMAILVISTNIAVSKSYINIVELPQKTKESTTKALPLKAILALLILGILAMITMGNEGAIEHWSGIYLIEVVHISNVSLAGIGYTVFSILMTIGRFFGDGISAKIGSMKIIILGFVLAALGYVLILLETVIIAVIGFGIVGLGLSVIIPELVRIAGKTKGVSASKSIALVSGIGFGGFLLGPIVLGYISNSYNLKMSFIVLLSLTVIAMIIAWIKLLSKT